MMDIKRFFLGPTLVEVAWEWRANTMRGEASKYNLISSINTYIAPFWKEKRIKRIKEKDVNNFVRFLQNLKNQKSGEALSQSTQWSAMKHMKAILNYAVKQHIIKRNPMQHVRIAIPSNKVNYYTMEQVKVLLQAEYPNKYYKMAVWLALCAGLRRGEVIALKWGDVDLNNRLLYIRRSVNLIKGIRYEKLPKSGKERTGIINPILYEIMKKGDESDQEYVVPLNPWQITAWFPTFAEKQGIPRLTFHALRRTFGTLLLQSGVDIKTVSVLLGHSSITVTSKSYIGTSRARMERAVNALYQ